MKLVDLDRLKPSNIAIFDMNLHNECVPMVRLSDLQALAPLEDVEPVEHGQWTEYITMARGYGKVWYQHTCTPLLYESPYYRCQIAAQRWRASVNEFRRIHDQAAGRADGTT